MENIIETHNLTKCYGKNISVMNCNLRVPQGCIYGFLGPNGAGKSTTMKMILNLVKPTSGTVELFGKEPTDKNRIEILKNTGSIIESPSFYGHLSGRENLQIVQMLKGTSVQEIDEVLAIVRMENQQNKKADHYSLGMKQRLGIAMALLGKPQLLLLDEPTNGLDPSGIQEMRELICSLPKRFGMTVLISSHLLTEIDQMVDHIGIIDKGELIYQDTFVNLQKHSQKNILIHTMDDSTAYTFLKNRFPDASVAKEGILLSDLTDIEVSELIANMVSLENRIVRVEERHKSLEDIFLGLTGRRMSL